MINIENTLQYNQMRRNKLGSKISSIWSEDSIFIGARSYPVLDFTYLTSNFSDFEKNVFKQNQKMIYHLSGYGVKFNEAFASYLGESVERYTFASFYNLVKELVITASYVFMCVNFSTNNVCELSLLNSYFSKDDINHYVTKEDRLQWIGMNSLINFGEKVYVPLQFVVSNNGEIYSKEKPFMTSAVSTGTACHENIQKAFENAVIEYLQIDSFNLWWYGGIKGRDIKIDMKEFLSRNFKCQDNIQRFLKNFIVNFTDISYDKDIDVIVCEIFARNDNLPKYTVGVQGGIGREKVLYRGLMEALAVLEYNMNLPWMDQEKYRKITRKSTGINNLDDNVILYAKYGKPKKVCHKIENFADSYKKTYNVLENIRRVSRYAGYLVITTPEFENMNLEVVRVSIPELLPLCLPSYPPYYHKRYETIGGIRNNVPHPLA